MTKKQRRDKESSAQSHREESTERALSIAGVRIGMFLWRQREGSMPIPDPQSDDIG